MDNADTFSSRIAVVLAAGSVLIAGCGMPVGGFDDDPTSAVATEQPVVYGSDNREDVYAFNDQDWAARVLDFTVALIQRSAIDASNPNDVTFNAPILQQRWDLCEGERFADQQTAASCSGTLIAPDLVLTAGHCLPSVDECQSTAFVFNYALSNASTPITVTREDVYHCSELVVQRQTEDLDYAIVRLDRVAAGHIPAEVRRTRTAPSLGAPLAVSGFPSGLPLKIADDAWVRDPRASTLDYFVANLDTFAGNSGSGVYLRDTSELVGILTRGATDYVQSDGCTVVNVCSDDGCRGEDSTYAFRAIDDLCNTSGSPDLCTSGVPDPGDACSAPAEIVAAGAQTLFGDTEGATNDHAGSCGGEVAPDHVYSFTLASPTLVDIQAEGYDTLVHLRTTCADSASEVACNDDNEPPGNHGSRISQELSAGTYFLVVDGYRGAGRYTLTAHFAPVEQGERCTEPTEAVASDDCDTPSARGPTSPVGCAVRQGGVLDSWFWLLVLPWLARRRAGAAR